MRVAALFLGLIAGLFALLAPSALRTDLLSPFLEVWSATSSERLFGIIAWYAIPAAALLGGLLATVTPGFAALLLLGAAAGWLGVGLSMPQHFNFLLIAPAATAALAAIFAFLAGELALRRRRMARRNRKVAAEALVEDGETEREAALQMDPLVMPRDEPPLPLRRPMPLTLDDVSVTSRPSTTAPGWQHNEPPRPQRGAGDWVEARRSAPPTQLPGDPPAGPEARAEAAEQARPTPRLVEVDIRPEAVLRPATPVAREPRPRRTSGLVAAMAALGAVLAFGILLASGYLLYRDGTLTNLFGPPGQAPAIAATSDAPAVTAATLPADPPPLPKLVAPKEVTIATPAAATAPALVATGTQPETYADPFSYCRAVKTIDHVDSGYNGPPFTEAMTKALLIPAGSARDRVRWRCFEGAVLACTSYAGPVCDMAPTVIEMREFCERNPNVEKLTAPSGPWSCADGRPQLPADASWPVDERGFLPDSWVVVLNIGGTPAG